MEGGDRRQQHGAQGVVKTPPSGPAHPVPCSALDPGLSLWTLGTLRVGGVWAALRFSVLSGAKAALAEALPLDARGSSRAKGHC